MVAPSRFCHIVLKSHRYKEMIDWYEHVLEARVQVMNDQIAFLTYDENHHRIAIGNLGEGVGQNASRGRHTVGVAHFAYAWRDLDGLLETYKRAKNYGVMPARCTRHGPTLSFYYDDPDGNNMEFQLDLLDVEDATKYMHTPEFDANPSGEAFDPEELLARYESGSPVNDLVYRSDQPQRLKQTLSRAHPAVVEFHM